MLLCSAQTRHHITYSVNIQLIFRLISGYINIFSYLGFFTTLPPSSLALSLSGIVFCAINRCRHLLSPIGFSCVFVCCLSLLFTSTWNYCLFFVNNSHERTDDRRRSFTSLHWSTEVQATLCAHSSDETNFFIPAGHDLNWCCLVTASTTSLLLVPNISINAGAVFLQSDTWVQFNSLVELKLKSMQVSSVPTLINEVVVYRPVKVCTNKSVLSTIINRFIFHLMFSSVSSHFSFLGFFLTDAN